MQTAATPVPADYRDLGRMLKDTREGMGLSLQEVTRAVHIRPNFLQALEKGELSAIPGDVYARGYLKTYADFLGYDGGELIGRIASGPVKQQATRYLPPDRSGNRMMSSVILGLSAAALLGAAYWQWHSEKEVAPTDLVQPLPESMAHLLDHGSPVIATPSSPLCETMVSTMAAQICQEGNPVAASLFDEKTSNLSIMSFENEYPFDQSDVMAAE